MAFAKIRMLFHFPSFSEGLSLRAYAAIWATTKIANFPSFSEGLSLRGVWVQCVHHVGEISLPFRRDFH